MTIVIVGITDQRRIRKDIAWPDTHTHTTTHTHARTFTCGCIVLFIIFFKKKIIIDQAVDSLPGSVGSSAS